MTFTNKAANEMKQRILQKLIQLSKEPTELTADDRSELQSFSAALGLAEEKIAENAGIVLNQILHNYSVFSVMTIDKFTHKIIRTFAKELGLSMDFDVELDLETMRRNVADLLFDQIGRDEEVTRLMIDYADSNLQEDKSWNFKGQLIEFSKQLFKEDALKAIRSLSEMSSEDFMKAKQRIIQERAQFESSLKRLGNEAMDLIRSKGLNEEDFAGKSKSITSYFERLEHGRVVRASDTIQKNVAEGKWGHPQSPNRANADELGDLLGKYFYQIEALYESGYADYLLNLELLKLVNNLSLMNHLLRITDQLKEEDNVLLISDFYKKIAEIISNEPVPFIYERLGVRYEHFLLDEFQDTSHLQWINLVPLIHNSLAEQKLNLIVGDGKQAIYRWRNGEVDQFVKLPAEIYNPEDIESLKEAAVTFKNEGDAIVLKDNFRSAAEIVQFNNGLFDFLAGKEDDYIQSIYQNGDQLPRKKHAGYLEFNLIREKENLPQLNYVKGVIERCKKLGYPFKDICILVRRNSEGSTIARFLTENGVPVVSQDSLWVSKDLKVRFIFNLICALSSPGNKNYAKKCIEQFDLIFGHSSHLFSLLDERIHIQKWMNEQGYTVRPNEQFHSFYEFVEHLIEVFDLNLDDNVYLQFLLEQVHLFEKKYSNNIPAFIDWFNDKGYRESIKTPEGLNAINIMTIHKAKGLQFPIVICAFCEWSSKGDGSERWLTNPEASIPAYLLKSTVSTKQTIHAAEMENEEIKGKLDMLNLVYVAFTRPETALFVCGTLNKNNSIAKEWIKPYLVTLGADDRDLFQLGELSSNQRPEEKRANQLELTFCKQKMDKPRLSTRNSDQWDIDDIDKKRLYGSQLHLILSKMTRYEDKEQVIQALSRKQRIQVERVLEFSQAVDRLFENEHFANYFAHAESMNEKVIIDELGNKHIPDKLLFKDNELIVVEFKTGEENTKAHVQQVRQYISLLSHIRPEKIRGEIFYTADCSITLVEA